jgi:hypothetical protein
MPAPQYSCSTEAAVALTAATAKSVVGVRAHANSGIMVCGFTISFADTNAAEVPALVELMYATFATNAPGTNSTSTTPRQIFGRSLAAGFTSARNWTAEPTVLTQAFNEFVLTPNGGTFVYNFPLGTEPDSALSEGFVLRVTAPSATDCRAGLIVSRI